MKYTFGIDPLQQYPGRIPRWTIAGAVTGLDSQPKEQGGQHWFHLYPNGGIKHDDIFHWTKLNQNWNSCAQSAIRPACARITMHWDAVGS